MYGHMTNRLNGKKDRLADIEEETVCQKGRAKKRKAVSDNQGDEQVGECGRPKTRMAYTIFKNLPLLRRQRKC